MKSLRVFIGPVLALILLALLIGYRGAVSGGLRAVRGSLLRVFDPGFSYASFESLRAENERLRAALALQKGDGARPSLPDFHYQTVAVYARYPLNDRERLIIDRGSAQGLATGTPVFVAPDVLLGTVVRTTRTRAEVQTIFDAGWKSSVAIGAGGVKAVLEGGTPPRLSLIPSDAALTVGDTVTNTSPEHPLGALVGTVRDITENKNDVWWVANVEVPYHAEIIGSVLVPTDFP